MRIFPQGNIRGWPPMYLNSERLPIQKRMFTLHERVHDVGPCRGDLQFATTDSEQNLRPVLDRKIVYIWRAMLEGASVVDRSKHGMLREISLSSFHPVFDSNTLAQNLESYKAGTLCQLFCKAHFHVTRIRITTSTSTRPNVSFFYCSDVLTADEPSQL